MCGIAGFHCWGAARPSPDTVKNLLLVNEIRGKDATGMAYIPANGGDILIRKDKMPANEFIKATPDNIWDEVSHSSTVLLHTRAKTKGDPSKNENNHPVYYNKSGWIVTHNGNVRNDDDLWDYYKGTRFAEVDSSAIPLVLGQGKDLNESIHHLSLLGGDATIAGWNENNRDWLVLGRFGNNDLFMFLDMDEGILYWSSTLMATHVLPAIGLHKLRFVTMTRLLDERVVKIGPKCEDTVVYKLTRNPFTQPKVHYTTGTKVGFSYTRGQDIKKPKKKEPVGRPSFRFERHDAKDGKFGTRPGPLWDGVEVVSTDLGSKLAEFHSTPSLLCDTMHTAYGRWIMKRNKQSIDRQFHASKRVRRYWHSYFNSMEAIPFPALPVLMNNDKTPYDNELAIETVLIHRTDEKGSTSTDLLYMCGWCGGMMKPVIWTSRGLRCQWCNIRSYVIST